MKDKAHTGLLLCLLLVLLVACNRSDAPSGTANPIAEQACNRMSSWPQDALTAADAVTVRADQFIAEQQLWEWGYELDAAGLRATGNVEHEAYIDRLALRLRCAGISDIGFEPVPIENQWLAQQWSLTVTDAIATTTVRTAAYLPYSGSTSTEGVTAPLVYLDVDTPATVANAAGKIVVFDVERSSLPIAGFALFTMGQYQIDTELTKNYTRPFLSNGPVEHRLQELEAAGALGSIAIAPEAFDTVRGTYAPYDGKLRHVPSLYVDKDEGAKLIAAINDNTQATLTLTSTVKPVVTRNLVAYIPGMSEELTVIHSHTDGTNSIEDNGPDAVIGIAQYLARLPRTALPRTVMVFLTAGHFTGGGAIKEFLRTHASDGLLERIASITTIEHLGAQEWEPDANGVLVDTGNDELGAMFMPESQALADAACDWFINADAGAGAVLKPLYPTGTGEPNDPVWPGEGQYFYGLANIPTVNYITGPYYLLNWGITTADKTDFDRMHRQMVAFTQMQLDLSLQAKAAIATERAAVATIGTGKYLAQGLCVPTPLPVSVSLP